MKHNYQYGCGFTFLMFYHIYNRSAGIWICAALPMENNTNQQRSFIAEIRTALPKRATGKRNAVCSDFR